MTVAKMSYLERIKKLETACAVISIVLAIYVLFDYDIAKIYISTWDEVFVASPNATLINSVAVFQNELSSFCGTGDTTNVAEVNFLPNSNSIGKTPRNTYHGAIFSVNKQKAVPYTIPLLFIFVLSFCFQIYRVLSIEYSQHEYKLKNAILYTPDGPDFSRWFEYLLTSPLQILIICSTVAIGENGSLYSMVFLQALLVVTGFLSEILIHNIYTSCSGCNGIHEKNRSSLQLIVVILVQWCAFYVLWVSIIDRYFRNIFLVYQCGTQQSANFKCTVQHTKNTCHDFDICEWNFSSNRCENNNKVPHTIDLIVWGQFVLFLFFGLVHTIQAIYACIYEHVTNTSEIWLFYSYIYSILSIIAKTILFVGIIVVVNELPA